MTRFAVPAPISSPFTVTSGPDAALWFLGTDELAHRNVLGRITLDGAITQFPMPSPSSALGLRQEITTGPDGNLWFTTGTDLIRRMSPGGELSEFVLPEGTRSEAITAGPDGNLWFTSVGTIGRITPAGVVTSFPLPLPLTLVWDITGGPDGNLWFTVHGGPGHVGRITPTGVISAFPIPTPYFARGITSGPDGNLWVTLLGTFVPGVRLATSPGGDSGRGGRWRSPEPR